ncbi:hypothetical protein MAR_014819 [Mya arenaria]|uniref:TIR domain-containing protein n=1 Tax=Mya arenaria TaxID=6604 RepID=A0ABY7FFB1_MYAAR|nr:hypothetical protein MAR_014819 [Mya arenaria]
MAQSNDISLDFNVIYNRALSPLSINDDETLSLKFTEFLVEKLKGWNFERGYYGDRDAVPGSNIFNTLNANVRNSSKTIVVITPGFLKNCWSKYQHQNAFKFLLDKDNSDCLVPIALDVQPDQVPQELNIQTKIYFSKTSYGYQESNKEWDKLRMAFDKTYRPENRVHSMPHTQAEYKETEYSTSTMQEMQLEEVTMDFSPAVTHVVITQDFSSMTIPSAPLVSLPPVRPPSHVSPPSNLKTDNSNIKAPEVEEKVTSTVSYTSQYSLSKDMDIETDQFVQKQVPHLSTDISHGQTAPPKSSNLSQVLDQSQGNLSDERKLEASQSSGKDFTDARTKIIEDEINIDKSVLPDITTDHTSNDSTSTVRKTMSKAEDTSSLYQSESELQLNVTSSLSLDSLNQDSTMSSGYTSYTSPVKEEVMMRQEQDVTEIQKVIYKRQEPDGSDDLKLGATAKSVQEISNQSTHQDGNDVKHISECRSNKNSKMGTETDKFSNNIAYDGDTVAARCQQHMRSLPAQMTATVDDFSLGQNRGAQSERRASSASMFGFGRGQRDQNNGWFNYAMRILSRPELAFN